MIKLFRSSSENWKLTDQSDVVLRPIREGDAAHLIEIFAHLGEQSRYQRFNTPVSNVSPDRVAFVADQMVNDSLTKGRGWLAFINDEEKVPQPVGGARYVRTEDHTAEVAVTVRDEMQRRGLGTLLLLRLIQTAQRDGIHHLTGMVQSQNKGVWRLLERSGYPIEYDHGGSETFFSMNVA